MRQIVDQSRGQSAWRPTCLAQVLVETQPESGQSQVGAPWMRGIDPKLDLNMNSLATNLCRQIRCQ